MEAVPKTPRVCEACQGTSVLPLGEGEEANPIDDGCPWCSGGYQDKIQQLRWREFRKAMSKISGTYSAFEQVFNTLLEKLRKRGREGDEAAFVLADEGEKHLQEWIKSHPATDARSEAMNKLLAFNRKGLDYLLPQEPQKNKKK